MVAVGNERERRLAMEKLPGDSRKLVFVQRHVGDRQHTEQQGLVKSVVRNRNRAKLQPDDKIREELNKDGIQGNALWDAV